MANDYTIKVKGIIRADSTKVYPSIEALFGPWNSFEEFRTYLGSIILKTVTDNDIPNGLEIGIKQSNNTLKRYKWTNPNNAEASWVLSDAVESVNGKTGAVTLSKSDIEGLGNVDNTPDASKNVNSAVKDGSGNNIALTYETKTDAQAKINALTRTSVGLGNVDNTADNAKIVKGANEDGSGNVISTTYETKTDATTKQTGLQTAIAAIQTTVDNLVGLEGTNFAGFSVDTTEADALTAIPTKYTTDGYTNELVWYLVGDGIDNLKAYSYDGTNTPVLVSSKVYDFTDFSGITADISTLRQDLNDLGLKIYDVKNESKFFSRLNNYNISTSTNKITSQSNYSVFYAPVEEGDRIAIKSTYSSSKTLITGFTTVLPDNNVAVDSVTSTSTASYNNTLTAPSDGYIVIASNTTYHANKTVTIGNAISVQGLSIDTTNGVIADGGETQAVYYIPTKAGYKYHITATNSEAKALRYGFTTAVPVVNAQVLSAQVINSANIDVDVTSEFDGYLVISHASLYFADMTVSVYTPKLNRLENDVDFTKTLLADIAFVKLKYDIVQYKKITQDGEVADSSAEGNRTLMADVSDFIGKTLYLDGVLYAASNTYCWYSFFDKDGLLVLKSNVSNGTTQQYLQEPVVVPEGAATLYVQGSNVSVFPNAKIKVNDAVSVGSNSGNSKSVRRFPLDLCQIRVSIGLPTAFSSYTNKANKHTIDYIRVHDSIKICNLNGITQNIMIFFYNSALSLVSYEILTDNNGLNEAIVENIPQTAKWFRLSFALADSAVGTKIEYDKFHVDVESEWGEGEETSKEPYVEYYPFLYTVKVNMPIKIADNPSIITKTIFAFDEGLIHLPSTYTPDGKPTPVIFYIHGDAERYEVGESIFSGHMKMQQCWSDAGFAQVDLDLIPSCYNEPTMASTGGVRNDLECLSAAWEWITNHFNVDKRGFYLIGRSRGGQCVFEILGKGGATKLPIIAAISMAGANNIFEYSVYSVADEAEWQLWCNAHGLPTTGRPTWGRTDTTKSFLSKEECYNFVVANWDLWWRKGLTGWGLITRNTDGITPKDYFDNYIYPYVQNNRTYTAAIEEFFEQMIDTMEAKSPIPLRLDWCVGDQTQTNEYFVSPHSYSSVFAEILLNTPASLTEYRRWDAVDENNPYGETNPHYAENMIFYDGDLTLPNGAVTTNPSKVTMEWLIWCMGKDPRYQGMNYILPWQ